MVERSPQKQPPGTGALVRCAIYTRKSTEEGLDREFNSLDAQREAAEAYVRSQKQQGWALLTERYDDRGFSGATLDRPALQRLLEDIDGGGVNCVVVYKVDRLSRSLLDFARLMERFQRSGVSFVAVTQQLNTSTSMGRLSLNILLSFAEFEREIIGERTRDKMRAARRKGKWIGGKPVLGYDVAAEGGRLIINEPEAERVRAIFDWYIGHRSLTAVLEELERRGWTTKPYRSKRGKLSGGNPFQQPTLFRLLTNALYAGKVEQGGNLYDGEQPAIIDLSVWQAIQNELRARPAARDGERSTRCQPLLNGLLYCEICSRTMMPISATAHGRQYRYYACRRSRGRQPGVRCPTRAISARLIEDSVIQQLRSRLGKESQPAWEQAEVEALLRQLVERVSYDGFTGRIKLQLAG